MVSEMLKNSIVYNLFASIGNWFSKQFNQSCLINRFLTEKATAELPQKGLFSQIFASIVELFKKLFSTA